jgi:hypothetical protein
MIEERDNDFRIGECLLKYCCFFCFLCCAPKIKAS